MCGRRSSAEADLLSILLINLIGGCHNVPFIKCSEESSVWHRVSQVEIESSGNVVGLGVLFSITIACPRDVCVCQQRQPGKFFDAHKKLPEARLMMCPP